MTANSTLLLAAMTAMGIANLDGVDMTSLMREFTAHKYKSKPKTETKARNIEKNRKAQRAAKRRKR